MYLFYDTETTGLPDFKTPAEKFAAHPGIAQLAAILADEYYNILGTFNLIVKQPESVPYSEDAAKVHGITKEMMNSYGVSPKLATRLFIEAMQKPITLVAHNEAFDRKMLRIEMHRNGYGEQAEKLRGLPGECTMRLADPIMKMEPTDKMLAAGFNKNKPPKLEEAYEYFTGKALENAHDAMADARAVMEIHRIIKSKGATND